MKEFKGIFTVLITPFKENGDIDYEGAKKNIDFQISQGIHGLVILGSTGEYQSVTIEEHKSYAEKMIAHVNGRVTTVVGTSKERPEDVIDLINHAKASGADGAMVLPSFYCRPLQEEIYAHYKKINDAVALPIMVYNNPHSAGVTIEYDTMVKIADLSNVQVVKESTGDIKNLTAVVMNLRDKVIPFCGWENLAFESFAVGAEGWVCVMSNFAPKMCVELYQAVSVEKDIVKGFDVYRKALPILNFLEGTPKTLQIVKYVMNKKGLSGGYIRSPRLELTADEKKVVDEAIDISKLY